MQGLVQSLGEELRSHMPHSVAKKKKKFKFIKKKTKTYILSKERNVAQETAALKRLGRSQFIYDG